MAKNSYTETLLHAWEQTYHKGHLTFWILIALKESPKSLEEIRSFIDLYGQSVVSYDDQSIYRALRKYEEIEMLQYELRDGDRGPQRKYYGLTSLGASVLQKFIERNILLFSQKKLHALLLK